MSANEQVTGRNICDAFESNQKCFRLQKYYEGNFIEIFHEHVPKHRISADNAIEFMKALIVRHSSFGDTEILRAYLNNKRGDPKAIHLGKVMTEYPEPGVLRKYYSSGNITAWFDEVVAPKGFRENK